MRKIETSRRRFTWWLLAAGLPAGLAAPGRAQAAGDADTELLVFAAASLRESFEALAPVFELAHPGCKVRLNFAGSQELRTQIEQGAQADVFAAADVKNMTALEKAGLVEAPRVFARNEPVLVVPHDNPAGLHALADLPRTRRLVIGAPEVPIGNYTLQIFAAAAQKYGADFRAKVEAAVVSRELNVRQVLGKVVLGEAEAGIVYRTDAQAARDKVQVIALPAALNVVAAYPAAAVRASRQMELARAWVQLLLSALGQRRLAAQGFLPAVSGTAPAATPAALGPVPGATQVPAR
jgi:molybdate transport system substrate-binding protein